MPSLEPPASRDWPGRVVDGDCLFLLRPVEKLSSTLKPAASGAFEWEKYGRWTALCPDGAGEILD
jgi:hypothetical protein